MERCCSNKPILEITYILGTKWLVCNDCLDLEEFSQDIKKRVRLEPQRLDKQVEDSVYSGDDGVE